MAWLHGFEFEAVFHFMGSMKEKHNIAWDGQMHGSLDCVWPHGFPALGPGFWLLLKLDSRTLHGMATWLSGFGFSLAIPDTEAPHCMRLAHAWHG